MDDLVTEARRLVESVRRQILGIAGAPGSGKSTLVELLVDELGSDAVGVSMDGFHLAQSQLVRLGRADRKGAPDTFDAEGFVALLTRIKHQQFGAPTIYAPRFQRDIEEPIAGAIAVDSGTPLVIIDGNYLLLDEPHWRGIRDLCDEIWFIEIDETTRLDRLVARHITFGKTPEAARAWAWGPDQHNAELIAASRHRADHIVSPPDRPPPLQ